jgi:tetratricopeptide (TPR) repeat protein
MGGREAIRAFVAAIAGLLAMGAAQAGVLGSTVEAQGCAAAIGGSVSGAVTVICGIPPDKFEALVKERTKPLEDLTAAQRETIATIKKELDVNEAQIRAALDTLGEKDIPPERLAAKLVEIAQQFKELRSAASPQPGDDAEIAALKSEVQQAIEAGERGRADDLLARIQTKQDAAQDRLAVEGAATRAQRGQVALAGLNFAEAAKRFADAARTLPGGDDYAAQRVAYLNSEASALYRQGDEFGDNAALASAIDRYRVILSGKPRERAPLDWAKTQMDLGIALARLGERESGTGRLEEAVAAFREALKENTRDRVPLDWAMTQMDLGNALATLGERESGTGRLEEGVAAYREALKENTRERVPLGWAMTQVDLGLALFRLGDRESGTGRLEEAVAAYREALREITRDGLRSTGRRRRWIWACRSERWGSGRAGWAGWRRRSRPFARR